MENFFITGTDTEIGKTYAAVALLKKLQHLGLSTTAMKPVASGCDLVDGKLINIDALALQEAATIKLDYDLVNPFAFKEPIAPHIAAKLCDTKISKQAIKEAIVTRLKTEADAIVIEGAGGWYLPLNEQQFMSEVVAELNLSVILVVGMKLGCLNHALLTARAIEASGTKLFGWIANCIDPQMPVLEQNIASLQNWLKAHCLGILPHNDKQAWQALDLSACELFI